MLESKLLLAALLGISLTGMIVSFVLALRLRTMSQQLRNLAAKPVLEQKPLAPGPPSRNEAVERIPELLKAGLSAHLERGWKQRQTCEKYRYIGLLAEHGMTTDQISRVLIIPDKEVGQVLALSKIARRKSPTDLHHKKSS